MLNAFWIVLLGMIVIFAVLGILFLAMSLVTRIVRPGAKKGEGQ